MVSSLEDVVKHNTVAVDDTNLLVKPGSGSSRLCGTRACYRSVVEQVVWRCQVLDVNFGFVITNSELVVLQVLRKTSHDCPEQCPIVSVAAPSIHALR